MGAGIVAAALLLGQSRVDVASAQYGEYGGGTPVNVNAARCILFRGGRESVPAGSLVVITGGWLSGTPGAVRSFLQAQTTIVSAGDGPMVDASGEYGPITNQPDGTSITRFSHSTGAVLGGPGSVMRFTFTQILSRPVVDVSMTTATAGPIRRSETRASRSAARVSSRPSRPSLFVSPWEPDRGLPWAAVRRSPHLRGIQGNPRKMQLFVSGLLPIHNRRSPEGNRSRNS